MIIGIVGFAGSGKDTVGDILVDNFGFKRDSFAKPLKDACAIIFGWDRTKLEGATKEDRAWREIPDEYWSEVFNKPFTPRLALQLMGTEACRRTFGEPIWTASLIRRVQSDPLHNYVITDVRFQNELSALSDSGALIVRVKRGEEPAYFNDAFNYNFDRYLWKDGVLQPRKPDSLKDIHQSEWDWIGSPFVMNIIDNCGTLDELKEKVLSIVPEVTL
jgi:hypothetical protein